MVRVQISSLLEQRGVMRAAFLILCTSIPLLGFAEEEANCSKAINKKKQEAFSLGNWLIKKSPPTQIIRLEKSPKGAIRQETHKKEVQKLSAQVAKLTEQLQKVEKAFAEAQKQQIQVGQLSVQIAELAKRLDKTEKAITQSKEDSKTEQPLPTQVAELYKGP